MCARIMEQGLIDLNWLHLIWTELTLHIYIYFDLKWVDWFDWLIWFVCLIDWLIDCLIDWLIVWLIDWLIPDHWDLNPPSIKNCGGWRKSISISVGYGLVTLQCIHHSSPSLETDRQPEKRIHFPSKKTSCFHVGTFRLCKKTWLDVVSLLHWKLW